MISQKKNPVHGTGFFILRAYDSVFSEGAVSVPIAGGVILEVFGSTGIFIDIESVAD